MPPVRSSPTAAAIAHPATLPPPAPAATSAAAPSWAMPAAAGAESGAAPASPLCAAPRPYHWTVAHRQCSYYEVLIKSVPRSRAAAAAQRHGFGPLSECVSVGLADRKLTADNVRREQAGWNRSSWALHGDNGNMYHNFAWGAPFGGADAFRARPTFGAGDVVGCGVLALGAAADDAGEHGLRRQTLEERGGNLYVVHEERAGIFFTLNGTFLGIAFLLRLCHSAFLWPCVGIDATWPLEFNFGHKPFMLDLDALLASLPADRGLQELRSSGVLMVNTWTRNLDNEDDDDSSSSGTHSVYGGGASISSSSSSSSSSRNSHITAHTTYYDSHTTTGSNSSTTSLLSSGSMSGTYGVSGDESDGHGGSGDGMWRQQVPGNMTDHREDETALE
eukprot:NODE_7885_length_1541_cov_9.096888.p1 GENE.NODE_7885_length_1541_cov_9.096888~~NODE_7885_length_1541_cov_9.096888.p1  ORF type:complete len:433 (+),score=105.58 NODE_7885_length_1541_cov_9.096888:132-1301(+)